MKGNSKRKNTAPQPLSTPAEAPSIQVIPEKTVAHIYRKIFAFLAAMLGFILLSDTIGLFESDDPNFHAKTNWEEFYQFTKNNEVDILLVGNSHLYTGINPQNLSCALGATSFIVAAPGTYVADSYYCLEEALTRTSPKVVVVETYGMDDFDPHTFTKSSLSDQIKSFDSRQNRWLKLKSTPALFSWDNYLYAWSTTIRNHDFLWSNPGLIGKNIAGLFASKQGSQPFTPRFGRFVRFQDGLDEGTLANYAIHGAPVKGQDYQYSKTAVAYVKKMKALSDKHGFKLVFLTLPMYEQHIEDYPTMRARMGQLINLISNDWLDLQQYYGAYGFNSACFENTYDANQHLTYLGSLKATYALAAYLDKLSLQLPNRTTDPQWNAYLKDETGYLENLPFMPTKTGDMLLARDTTISGVPVKEAFIHSNDGSREVLFKFDKTTLSADQARLRLVASLGMTNQGKPSVLDLPMYQSDYWKPLDHYLFYSKIPAEANVEELLSITFVRPE